MVETPVVPVVPALDTIIEEKPSLEARYERQSQILATEKMKLVTAVIVGTGAIGSRVAVDLASMGVGNIVLIDFDTIDVVNLGAQGFKEADLGKLKVEVIAEECRQRNKEINIQAHPTRFMGDRFRSWKIPSPVVVFSCVDSLTARKGIWENAKAHIDYLFDGRMMGGNIRILAADPKEPLYYESKLFAQEEATQGACTSRSLLYAAGIAAGLMIEEFSLWVRGAKPLKDAMYNLDAHLIDLDLAEF